MIVRQKIEVFKNCVVCNKEFYQGCNFIMNDYKDKYLFVCSVNRYRSRTAHHHFAYKLANTQFQIKSCGTDIDFINQAKASGELEFQESIPISRQLVEWADIILCMENSHADFIRKNYGDDIRKKCYVLNIPDIYHYDSPELKMILEYKVKWRIKR